MQAVAGVFGQRDGAEGELLVVIYVVYVVIYDSG